jgi:hypothetical protein
VPKLSIWYTLFLVTRSLPVVSAQTQPQIAYASITADGSHRTPSTLALLSYRNSSGVLISEAAVASVEPILNGSMLVDEAETRTGIALVNTASTDAIVTLTLRDSIGQAIARQTFPLSSRNQSARYISEVFPARPADFRGSLTFESNQPIGAIALRETRNRYGEPLYTTFPVVNLSANVTAGKIAFSHIVAGDGYSTQLILRNPTDSTMRGQVGFYGQDGGGLVVRLGTMDLTSVPYEIQGQGIFRVDLYNPAGLHVGWAEVQPDSDTLTPVGIAVLQYRVGGEVVTESTVSATLAVASARFLIDGAGTRTGVAVANTSSSSTALNFQLLDLNGNTQSTASRTLQPRSQLAIFTDELFPDVSDGFNGVIEISGSNAFVALSLKVTRNSRGDFILTTLPVADRLDSQNATLLPQIALGSGFSTKLILLNGDLTNAVAGSANLYDSVGANAGRLNYRVSAGTSMTLFLDSTTPIQSVVYTNDFNGPAGSTYPEWSVATYSWTGNEAGTLAPGSGTETITNVDSYNSAERFLGELGGPAILKGPPYDARHFVRVDESIQLSLNTLPAHTSLTVAFDLYVLKSWDGDNSVYGPDRSKLAISGGPTLLDTTFSNNFKTGVDLSLQDYPAVNSPPQTGASTVNRLGYGFWFGDSTYHFSFTIPHNSGSVVFVFSSSMNEGKSEPTHSTRDESWGLDNIRVTVR